MFRVLMAELDMLNSQSQTRVLNAAASRLLVYVRYSTSAAKL
jgi:hypothetical protein